MWNTLKLATPFVDWRNVVGNRVKKGETKIFLPVVRSIHLPFWKQTKASLATFFAKKLQTTRKRLKVPTDAFCARQFAAPECVDVAQQLPASRMILKVIPNYLSGRIGLRKHFHKSKMTARFYKKKKKKKKKKKIRF